jgi:hypothetical protein
MVFIINAAIHWANCSTLGFVVEANTFSALVWHDEVQVRTDGLLLLVCVD